MSDIAIKVESLGKAYRLGTREARPDTLVSAAASVVTAPWRNFRRLRRLDTFATDRTSDDILWALRDVSFEVREGEVLGFVGRNGAGKSTLLKMLSRIVEPTEGRATLRGRISSLLEVGTGFHPELTGRENVYMNGTILGMKKREIDRKFDEIVDFSGIERFLDTPIKRYSSGMKVRLAFSVAAHLEPELLIVDEVLAVGDAEFQRKCLGKMQDVAGTGRTVLFVSHNMGAVQALCSRAIALRQGRMIDDGDPQTIIGDYLASMRDSSQCGFSIDNPHRQTKGDAVITDGRLLNAAGQEASDFTAGEPMTIELDYANPRGREPLEIFATLRDAGSNTPLVHLKPDYVDQRLGTGRSGTFRCTIPRLPLALGDYRIGVMLKADRKISDHIPNAMLFSVQTSIFYAAGRTPTTQLGYFLTDQVWEEVVNEALRPSREREDPARAPVN
ncbi:ABC transporter ATP-binding protein [Caenispirillum salinarum]|uniref:ABC transporter ATP-binding protein n=1 Tax=Caenispirillum salinarum TaxID=859058 RepID=UPI00384E92D5